MKIEYTKVGDYYLPNLYYPEETTWNFSTLLSTS